MAGLFDFLRRQQPGALATPDPGALAQTQEPGILDRLTSPQSSEMLLGLGAGLLQGRDFPSGLGQGLENVLGVRQQQQARDLAKAGIEAKGHKAQLDQLYRQQQLAMGQRRIEQGDKRLDRQTDLAEKRLRLAEMKATRGTPATPAHYQDGNTYIDPASGATFRETFDPNRGAFSLRNMQTGEAVNQLPPTAIRAEQSGLQWTNKEEAEAKTGAAQAATKALGDIPKLERLREIGAKVAGPTYWDAAGRTLAETLGTGWMSPDDVTEAKQLVADMVTQEIGRLRGLGHMSDREFAAIKLLVANPETLTEASFLQVIDRMIAAKQGEIGLYDAWRGSSPDQRDRGFLDFQYEWVRQRSQGAPPEAQPTAAAPQQAPVTPGVPMTSYNQPPANPQELVGRVMADPEIEALLRKYPPK